MKSEIQRKLFHLLGFIYVFCLAKIPRPQFIVSFSVVWAVVFLFEFIRLKNPFIRQWFDRSFGFLLRAEEKTHFSGAMWMILGVLSASILCKPFVLAATAVLYLLLGDAAASLVGKSIRGPKWIGSQKSLSGSAACFLVCVGVGFFTLYAYYSWPLVIAGAAVATLIELGFIPLNDNLLIPLFSALFFKTWIYFVKI